MGFSIKDIFSKKKHIEETPLEQCVLKTFIFKLDKHSTFSKTFKHNSVVDLYVQGDRIYPEFLNDAINNGILIEKEEENI